MKDRVLGYIVTNQKRKPTVWRWIREQDGVQYVLFKGSMWKIKRSKVTFDAYELERLVILS